MLPAEASTAQLQGLLDRGVPDARVYEQLIGQASGRLLRLTRKMLRAYPHLRRWEQTDDIFQSAAMKLYRSLASVQPGSVREFFGLAAVQIRRTLIDLVRSHFGTEGAAGHHQSDHGGAPGSERPARGDPASGDCRPETLAEWSEFHEAIERLPADERDVFHLIWYAGLPQKDIAELLHVSIPTIQRRWYAAQIKLRELLMGEPPTQGEGT